LKIVTGVRFLEASDSGDQFSFLEANSIHENFANILPETKKEDLPPPRQAHKSDIDSENLQPVANPGSVTI